MTGIPLASGFDLNSPVPLDSRTQVTDLTARDAIPNGKRYEGLVVYDKGGGKQYTLKGGIANTNWKEVITAEITDSLTSQMADLGTQKADKTEVNTLATGKADKTYVDGELVNKADKTYVDLVKSGTPKIVKNTLAELNTAYPTGSTDLALVLGDVKEVASLTVTAAPTTSGNVTVTLNGIATNIAVTTGVKEVASLTVTAIPTTIGNVTITLNGVTTTVAVDPATDTTTDLVATKIRNTVYPTGAVTGGTGSTVTFTASAVGVKTDAVYSAGTTGSTGTMTTTTQGVDADTTTDLVATKIRNTVFPNGAVTGGTGSTVTFTAASGGVKTDATYSAGSTGATGSMTTTTQGVAADGKWYYWNGSAWTAGVVYQSTGIAPESITLKELSFKAISGKVGKNLFNKDTAIADKYVSNTTGAILSQTGLHASDWIPALPNTPYIRVKNRLMAFYDANKTYISGFPDGASAGKFTTPSNCYFVRISVLSTDIGVEQLELGTVSTAYEPYTIVLDATKIEKSSIAKDKLNFVPLEGKVGKNLFNNDIAISGKYLAYVDGTTGNNASYYASDWIPVLPSTQYIRKISDQLAFYDVNKTYISGQLNGTAISTPSNCYFVRFSVPIAQINNEQFELGTVSTNYVPFGFYIESKDIQEGIISYNHFDEETKVLFAQATGVLNPNFAIVAKDGTGDFTSINEAVQSVNNGATIIVRPGVYIESVHARTKEICLIGTNKNYCILKSQSSLRDEAPLEASAGYIANMTIYAEKVVGATWDEADINYRPYGIHIDYDNEADKTLEFFNCDIKSDWNAACGIGLRKGFKLVFKSCDLTTNIYEGATGIGSPLYFHESQVAGLKGDQFIIVDNCNLYAKKGAVVIPYSLQDLTNKVYMTFKRNSLYSGTLGKTNVVDMWGDVEGGTQFMGSNNFYLTGDSFGNNVTELNA